MTDARKQRSLKAITQAGLKLLAHNDETTLVDVAKEAGVGRATVYRAFANKNELVRAVAIYCLERIDEVNIQVEQQATSVLDAIRLILVNTLPLTEEFAFLAKVGTLCAEDEQIKAHIAAQDETMLQLFRDGMTTGEIAAKFDESWLVLFFEGLAWSAIRGIVEGKIAVEDAADFAFESFKNGVGAQ